MDFRATVIQSGKTATGIEVPAAIVEALGAGKRPPVRVTINGYGYRTTVAPMGGVFMIPVSAEIRAGTGVAGGDEVTVTIEHDAAPREVVVPPDLAAALDGDADARRAFHALSYSNQRRHVLSVEGAKSAETRARRVAGAVAALREGKG